MDFVLESLTLSTTLDKEEGIASCLFPQKNDCLNRARNWLLISSQKFIADFHSETDC